MALTATTLSAAITANQTTFAVASTTGFPAVGLVGQNQTVKIDNEYMVCTGVPISGTITVRARGDQGTPAVAHSALAFVQTSSNTADFPVTPPQSDVPIAPYATDVVTLGTDVTLACPSKDTVYIIDKATAIAVTLSAPTTGQDGRTIRFIVNTPTLAHVITATSLIADGVSGSPHTTITPAQFKGASITLMAQQGLWAVVAAVGAPVT